MSGAPGAPQAVARRRTDLRAAGVAVAAAVLLAGPTVLAFTHGGYFATGRLRAAIVAWMLVAVAALAAPAPVPRAWPGRLALGGLAGLLAWVLASRGWAPLWGPATDDAERLALYLAVLIAAAAVLRDARADLAEPAVAAGAVVVVGYGLAERVLPGVIDLAGSRSAFGRLEQPLTYWNAMGALAAMGLVLCARLAGDGRRPRALRAGAGAAAPLLGAGLALTFSRGSIAAALIGLGGLLALAPGGVQARAAAIVTAVALAAGVLAAALGAVQEPAGPLGRREAQGVVLLVALVAFGAAAAVAVRRLADSPAARRLAGVRPAAVVAGLVVAVAIMAGAAAVEGGPERGATGGGAARLGSADSNRYAYWRVALNGFADAPLRGHGSGSFGVLWLRDRTVPEVVHDAHSLELETAAELGLVGLALLAALLGGVAWAAMRARRLAPGRVAGPAAALAVWAAHSALDWDWELPAGVTLSALVLAGVLIGLADGR